MSTSEKKNLKVMQQLVHKCCKILPPHPHANKFGKIVKAEYVEVLEKSALRIDLQCGYCYVFQLSQLKVL